MFRRLFSLSKSDEKAPDSNHCAIDTDCNYCPKCGDAYRTEIETCSACSIPLISGLEKLAIVGQQEPVSHSDFTEISADDELVSIQVGKLVYLKSLQQVLKKEYVPSILAGDNISKG